MTDARPALPYADVRTSLRDGTVLLFRGTGLFSRLIQAKGRAPYSHAALLAWWGHRLMVVESREGAGVRAIPLSTVLEEGHDVEAWDVVGLSPLGDERRAAVGEAISWLSTRYGWRTILRIGLAALLVPLAWIRPIGALRARWSRPLRDSRGRPTSGLICSELVARAWEAAGVPLVPNLPEWDDATIEPGDLPRGGRLTLLGRFVPPWIRENDDVPTAADVAAAKREGA